MCIILTILYGEEMKWPTYEKYILKPILIFVGLLFAICVILWIMKGRMPIRIPQNPVLYAATIDNGALDNSVRKVLKGIKFKNHYRQENDIR